MRLVTYQSDRGPRAGVLLDGDRVVDAWDALGGGCGTVRGLLKADRFAELADAVADAEGEPLADGGLLPPVPDPEKIIGIGLNYRTHAEETNQEPPEVPTIFGKFRNALAAPDATVTLPAASAKVDYEAEVCAVLGRRLKEVGLDEARDGVAGYTLMNDLSARDLQLATTQWMAGKTFDGAAPCGPALVTADEVDHGAIEFALSLNGEEMQASGTSDLIFSIPAAGRPPVHTHDPRTGRSDRHGHPLRGWHRPAAERLASAGGRDRDQLAPAGPAPNSRGLRPPSDARRRSCITCGR